jgi:hypothetical protein
MQLTEPQKVALKAHIIATPDLEFMFTEGNLAGLADALNANAPGPYIVWRTNVTDQEIMLNGFDWARVDNLAAGQARIWDWMFRFGSINPSKPNIRLGIEATWKGTAADLAVRAAVYVHCKRSASRFEKLFAVGAGTTAEPAVMGAEGPLPFDALMNL